MAADLGGIVTRRIFCVKAKEMLEGLKEPPFFSRIGIMIFKSISQREWKKWISIQTTLINEHKLDLSVLAVRNFLMNQIKEHLFGDVEKSL